MSKKRMLCWGDSPDAGTGYGTVCRHVIDAFYKTGRFDIHQLAINHLGRFSDTTPWQQIPAKMADPSDLYGTKMFVQTLIQGRYDYVWIVNDIFAVAKIVPELKKAKAAQKVFPKLIFYFPVDCAVLPAHKETLELMDHLICYNEWSLQQVLAVHPGLASKLRVIAHGVDHQHFFKLPQAERNAQRKQALRISEDTCLVIAVNRNSMRKQIPYSMLAFKEFRKKVPNSVFYIHSAMKDQGGDLQVAAMAAGLKPGEILFPAGFSAAKTVPIEQLNRIYNWGDMFLTTHLGEGYGLTVAESMAAGTPVVAPRNTSMPDLLGASEERGYMYECKDLAWIDSSGFRPKGLIPDIVGKMLQCHQTDKYSSPKMDAAQAWTKANGWDQIAVKWQQCMQDIERAQASNG